MSPLKNSDGSREWELRPSTALPLLDGPTGRLRRGAWHPARHRTESDPSGFLNGLLETLVELPHSGVGLFR